MFRDLLLLGLTLAKLKRHFSIFYENLPFPSPPLYGSVLWTNIKQKKQGWFYSREYISIFYQYLGRHRLPSSPYCTHYFRGSAAKSIRHSSAAKKQYIQHSYANPASYAGYHDIFCSSASSLSFLLCMFSVIKSDFIGFVCARWVILALVIQLIHAHRLTQANCLS